MKYKVIATFVFEDVEAESEDDAINAVDVNSFENFIYHPDSEVVVNPSFEVELSEVN